MARMIPSGGPPEVPLSERRLFEMLRVDRAARNWTVFHSQGVSSAYTGHYGEADFVAVIPELGLLCIEVKGGGVRCRDGVWSSTSRDGETHVYKRSPALQAQQTVHKLRSALEKRFGRNSPEARCPIGWMVVLTDAYAPPPSPEFTREEVIDCGELIDGFAQKLAAAPSLAVELSRFGAPSGAVLQSIQRFLRPDFDRVETLSTTLWDAERRLIALTDEQYDVLDHVMDNPISLIQGGAGTGKTLLAVELARKLADRGSSVLLTCFNRELGLWLEGRAAEAGSDRIVASNLHRLLSPAVAASGLSAGDGFQPEWYEAAALVLADLDQRFDTVIIDEAQDFPVDAVMNIAEQWTEGSTAEPRICLFADFSRQALYDDPASARAAVRRRVAGASFTLRTNCRNTRRITAETELLTGSFDIRPLPEAPDGPSVDREFHGDGKGPAAVDRVLQRLRGEGFAPEDIVILSPRRRENSVVAGLDSAGGYRILDRAERRGATGVAFSTIHAFKGLESKAVVLVDVEPAPDAATDSLMYVGMTRAQLRLALVMHEKYQAELERRTAANLRAALASEVA